MLAEFNQASDSVILGIPTVGTVKVSASGVEVMAPEGGHEAVEQRLRLWSVAQYLLARGWGVMAGTVVTRAHSATAITGPARSGVTLLALALCEHGFALASDGIIVWDAAGKAASMPWRARVDATPAAALFPRLERDDAAVGRPRVECGPVPTAGSVPLTGLLYVHDQWDSATAEIIGPRSAADLVHAGVLGSLPALVPGSPPPRSLPDMPAWTIARPVPRDVDMMQRHAPHRLAELVAPVLAIGVP